MSDQPKPTRGGSRPTPKEVKRAAVKRVITIISGGYSLEVACKRVRTTPCTAHKWAKELGIELKTSRL